ALGIKQAILWWASGCWRASSCTTCFNRSRESTMTSLCWRRCWQRSLAARASAAAARIRRLQLGQPTAEAFLSSFLAGTISTGSGSSCAAMVSSPIRIATGS
ncbi:unnamed protein product, partial [Symbiodinium microadriaticum]